MLELGDAAPRFALVLCECGDVDSIRKTLSRIPDEVGHWLEEVVIMLGDDRHDVRAFDALRATSAGGRTRGLAVGVLSPAADPAEVARRADVVLATSDEAARFLTLVARERT